VEELYIIRGSTKDLYLETAPLFKTIMIEYLIDYKDIPENLKEDWESYLNCCYSLAVEPNKRRFLRYNELYPYK